MKQFSRLQALDRDIYERQSRVLASAPEEVARHFVVMAKWYKCFLRQYLPKERDARIVDVPCGHGRLIYALNSLGYTNVVGYDIDPGRVQLARGYGFRAHVSDAFAALRAEDEVRLLTSIDFIEHLEKEAVPEFFSCCYRAVSSGGLFIVRAPFADGVFGFEDFGNDYTHKWTACSGVIRDLMLHAGFQSCIVLDESPQPVSALHLMRLGLSKVLRPLTNLWLVTLGLRPRRVWTSSGWLVATR